MTPRFIPFADMTEQEQREHLWRLHGVVEVRRTSTGDRKGFHEYDHIAMKSNLANRDPFTPHTHDKPARRNA